MLTAQNTNEKTKMRTEIVRKQNGCYSISARITDSKLVCLEIGDTEQWICIGLNEKDAVDFCNSILDNLRK